ncbi:hypothetical protein FOXB_05038 [Fusarium oxysporum f. sp. conglutinans Fo5176]|uniref:MARVEL domain-containing protein n=3 Tax=Fusarium oxysporum TaxID=5507 RepID=F9FF59_FUSOF|nr:hypothetical protein FOXB_05038 [Fusarium oxysporum f. sp. conglutinans Fo5176]
MAKFLSSGLFPYQPIPFLVAKSFQVISSCLVAGIMFFFIAHLNQEHVKIPWMFFFLQGSALATLVSITAMGIWIVLRSPVPKTSAFVNAVLAALWATGYGLLINAIEPTILIPCTKRRWGNDRGILVCGLYKTLLAVGGTGLLSSIAMVVVDITAARRLKLGIRGSKEREKLLSKDGGETEYAPVWAGQSTTPVGLEPMRDE